MISEPDDEQESYEPLHETEVFDIDSDEHTQSLIVPQTYE